MSFSKKENQFIKSNNWYVFTVKIGSEQDFINFIHKVFPDKAKALIPKKVMIVRKKGNLFKRVFPLLPGCIIIKTDYAEEIHKEAEKLSFYLENRPVIIPDHEISILLSLLKDGNTIGFSCIEKKGEIIDVKSGPLQGLSDLIIKCNHRKMRVRVSLPFLGERLEVDLGAYINRGAI